MFKKFLRKNFFKLFYFFKTLNYYFNNKSINNTQFYIRDLKVVARQLNIDDKKPLIIDVGSHIGNEAQYLIEFYPGARIHCFEPVKEVFQKLKKRFSLNNNIECHNNFVGSKEMDQNIDMYIDPKTDLVGSYYSMTDLTKTTSQKISVKTETLDNFIKNKDIENIFLLRIDVNGYEKNVLEGAEKILLQKKIDFILVYFFNVITKLECGSLYEIAKYLNKKNYRLISFYNNFFHQEYNGGYYSAIFVKNNL